MGIFSDTLEDNKERAGQFLQPMDQFESTPWVLQSPQLEKCTLCGRQLPKDDMPRHMYSHAGVSSYLIANNQIIRDVAYANKPLESLDICTLGQETARVELRINSELFWVDDIKGQYSFGDQFKNLRDGELVFKIVDFNGERLHRIYVGTQPLIRHSEIDQLAFKFLFLPLDMNSDPDYEQYRREASNLNLEPLEELYVNSFYDYALGYRILQCNRLQEGHLESALYGLSRFRTNFAVAGQRILALRMNCFNILRNCKSTSRFFLASLFFCQPFNTHHQITAVELIESEYGIYVDPLTINFLEAISAYYSASKEIFFGILTKLYDGVADHDTNNHAKLFILEARYWRRLGETKKARDNYEKLLTDPDLCHEARGFLYEK